MIRESILFPLSGLALCLWVTGCATKGLTPPRSQIIEDARRKGLEVASLEEEKQAFYAIEEVQKKRLMALLRKRSSADGARDSSYRIGPQDEVEINVFDVPEMNVSVRVNQSGFVSLPLVGAVKAGGLTESDLRDSLRQRLSAYVRNPQISVFISNYGSQKVAVMGAVRNPGTYALKKGSNSILELISEAGGVSEKAGNFLNFIPAELTGIESANDVEARARFALDVESSQKLRNAALEVYLDQVMGTSGGVPIEIPIRGGDMIIIPESGKVMVEGEVEKSGSYDLGPQMTLLGALAASGGITYGAKVDEVEIVREVSPGTKGRLVLDLSRLATGEDNDPRLRNGDIVRVPSDSGRRLTQDTFEGISKLINFGIGGSVPLR